MRSMRFAKDVGGGAPTALTDANDADAGEFDDSPGARTLTVACGSLSPGETCTVTYDLVIQQPRFSCRHPYENPNRVTHTTIPGESLGRRDVLGCA